MSNAFQLLDLPSQALAVQRLLGGRPEDEKLAWLNAHGKLVSIPSGVSGDRPLYDFESVIGRKCNFFFAGDESVFFGDNTTYTVKG